MVTKSVKLKDLRAATEASVKAVLGKNLEFQPGVLVGFWLEKASLSKLDKTAEAVAKDVARQVSLASGIRVTPGVKPGTGGVLVGYIQPRIFKE